MTPAQAREWDIGGRAVVRISAFNIDAAIRSDGDDGSLERLMIADFHDAELAHWFVMNCEPPEGMAFMSIDLANAEPVEN